MLKSKRVENPQIGCSKLFLQNEECHNNFERTAFGKENLCIPYSKP
jgi:hypothetical protein